MNSKLRVAQLAAAAFITAAALPSMAATTWSRSDGTCAAVGNGSTMGNSCKATKDGIEATVRAYSNSDSDGTWATAALTAYSGGFGVNNGKAGSTDPGEGGDPEHAVDNNGLTDGVLFKFSSSISLSALSIGWSNTDADISVFAWTGTGDPVNATNTGGTMFGQTAAGLMGGSSGWTLVGNYADVNDLAPSGSGGNLTITTGVTSSWWLVSAYNANFGGTCTKSGGTEINNSLCAGNDYFKLLSVTGSVKTPPDSQTPEPASLALVGLAALGMGWARRGRAQV